LALVLVAPLLLGGLLAFLLRGGGVPYAYSYNPDISRFFFLSIIVFLLFGLMGGIGEYIKDRPKLLRERLLNIRGLQ